MTKRRVRPGDWARVTCPDCRGMGMKAYFDDLDTIVRYYDCDTCQGMGKITIARRRKLEGTDRESQSQ